MKNREDRTMMDLYDRTHKIPRLKIEGNSCKEPLDQSVNESGGINENNKSPSRKRSISDDDNPCRKPGSGTCNVCNTPCTSCMHRMRVDTDTCSFVGTCSEHFHCENAETESNLRNPIKPKPFDIGIVNQEGQGENTSCITKHTKEKDIQRIDSHRESSSDNCKEESLEKKWFDSTDSLEKSDSNFRVPKKNSACNEKMLGGLENRDKRDFSEKDQMQVQKVVEVKNQETDNGLVDVKVCDICGDTGREELLATCSRCIDGAEHTYCMRVRLEKLPEGDWLCEECQLKDKAEKKKKRHTETSPLSTPLPEKENRSELVNSKNPFSHHKKLRISTDRAVYTSVPPPSPHKSLKEVISPGKSSNLARENSVKMEIFSSKEVISLRKTTNLAREKSLKAEISFSKEVISPRKTSNLARENSEKTEIISSKEVISPRKASNLARENSLKKGIGSSKEVMSPRKTSNLARENSVKTEIGSSKELISPRKTSNLCRENSMKMEICSLKSSSGGQFMKKSHLSRSYSLNHVSSVRDVEKSQAEMPPPKGTMTKHLSFKTTSMKPKIKSMTESIPTKQKTLGFSLLKPTEEARPFRRLIKSASLKEASSSRANTDSVKRTKPLSPTVKVNAPKLSEMSAEREKSSLENKYSKGESHTNVLAQQPSTVKKFEYKTEGSVPKKPDWGTSCSHMEPALEDKKMSKPVLTKQHEANKNPRNIPASKESDKKFKRLKTAVKTVPPEAKDGGNSKISDKPKVLLSRSGVSHNSKNQKAISIDVEEKSRSTFSDKSRVEKASKNVLSLASSVEKEESFDLDVISPNVGVEKMKAPKDVLSISSTLDKEKMVGIDVNTIAVGVEKMKAPKDMLSQAQSLEKLMDSNGISVNVRNVEVKPSTPVVDESSLVKTPSETLAIPEQDFVWQGSFQILRVRTQAQESFDGIQAHLSTHVSPKVFEVVTKFSDKLQLEEVPSGTVWPVQFQKTEPSEEHVALFFFARDLESYESYSRLLESLIGDNLALRVDICGAELLIFPSDKLPKQSQRWNSLLYLWGIFRARKQVPSKIILNSAKPKPIGGPSGHFPTKINEDVKPSKELTIGDHLPKPEVENVAGYLDLGREPCKKPVEQNALKCLDSSAFCSEQEALNASHASFTKICATQAEDANEKIASLPILPRKMAENIADDNKIMSLEKPRDAELKAGNKRPHLSDETSYEEMGLKKRKESDGFQIEAENKSSTLLKKLTSPKIHPLSIDLEKPADACDAYSAEDGESSSLRNTGWSKMGSSAIKVISSDDNDAPENKMPNLKLALGNKNPSHKVVLPLPLFPLARLKEEESDASPSLSLTIAPPGLEKGVERPVVKIQQFLQEKPGVKPLRLFGGYINP